jgi:hypothetical protein
MSHFGKPAPPAQALEIAGRNGGRDVLSDHAVAGCGRGERPSCGHTR